MSASNQRNQRNQGTHGTQDNQGNPAWLARATMLMLGMALLLPWNAHIKAITYLRLRLTGTTLATSFPNYITATFSTVNTVSVLLNTLTSSLRADGGGVERRVLFGLGMNVVLLLTTIGFVVMDGATRMQWMAPYTYFASWLTVVAVTGMATSLMQQGGFALAGRMPSGLAPWFLAGQGLAGTLVSLAALIADVADPGGEKTVPVAIGYFSIALVLLVAAVVVFVVACRGGCQGLSLDSFAQTTAIIISNDAKPDKRRPRWSTIKPVKWHCVGIWLTFFTTLSLFPFTVTLFKTDLRFFAPIAFIVFDVGDLIGKALPSIVAVPGEQVVLLAPWLRTIFVPLLLLGKYNGRGHHVYTSPFLFLFFMFALAVTGGLCNTWLLMTAPMRVDGSGRRETVGAMIGLFLIVGISTGSIASFAWRSVVV